MTQSKHLRDVRELADQHAHAMKRRTPMTDSELETLADEAYWNAVYPLLENRGADTEGAVQGATLEEHYIRAFVAAYRTPVKASKPAGKTKSKSKPDTKPKTKTRPRPPLRGLAEPSDPNGETLRLVRAYVTSGANVNKLLDEGGVFMEPLLHLAAAHHHIAIMKYLLEHGADPELANGTSGERALHVAIAAADDPAAVALLLDHGADPNAATLNGARPLHDAIIMQRAKTVELLLARGADPARTIRYAKSDLDALQLCDARRVTKRIRAQVEKKHRGATRTAAITPR